MVGLDAPATPASISRCRQEARDRWKPPEGSPRRGQVRAAAGTGHHPVRETKSTPPA